MAQRFGTIVTGALAGVLALGTMAGTARAQDTTHQARTTTQRKTTTTHKNQPMQHRRDSTGMRSDTSAYRSMDSKADTTVRTDTTADSSRVRDTTAAHFNRDSAQTAPRATTTKGLPGVQGPPAGAGSPGIVTSADTTGRGANGAGGKPGGPPVTAPRTDTMTTTPSTTPGTTPTPGTTTTTPPR